MPPNFASTGLRVDKEGARTLLDKIFSLASLLGSSSQRTRLPEIGKRELDALEALWECGALTAQATLRHMQPTNISLSTVQSTLERLNRKALVSREKVGRSFVYSAALSKQTIISRMMREIADSLTGGDVAPMVSGFLDYLETDDPETDAQRVIIERSTSDLTTRGRQHE